MARLGTEETIEDIIETCATRINNILKGRKSGALSPDEHLDLRAYAEVIGRLRNPRSNL
jgi:hypothetical protein